MRDDGVWLMLAFELLQDFICDLQKRGLFLLVIEFTLCCGLLILVGVINGIAKEVTDPFEYAQGVVIAHCQNQVGPIPIHRKLVKPTILSADIEVLKPIRARSRLEQHLKLHRSLARISNIDNSQCVLFKTDVLRLRKNASCSHFISLIPVREKIQWGIRNGIQ